MKLVFISDTHNLHDQIRVPDGDILIHSGDATGRGSVREVLEFNQWLGKLPHKIKIFVPGNHDWLFEKDPALAKSLMTNAIVLHDELINIEGLNIYGSPYQPEFCNWAFNLPRGKALAEKWSHIPEGLDVLITHGPPHNVLDEVIEFYSVEPGAGRLSGRRGTRVMRVGCEDLARRVEVVQPKIHVFGHIHLCHGQEKKQWPSGKETLFINAANCTEDYKPLNEPIVVEV